MPRKLSFSIGEQQFNRKLDALNFLKAILRRYYPGDRVSDADTEFLKLALARHPDAKDKLGCGIAAIEVRSAEYGQQCFWILRTDGTEVRFSYKACV